MAFKQRFKYLKNEKINLIKAILKQECLVYRNIHILLNLFIYSKSHFDSNKSKKCTSRKKNLPNGISF